MPPNTTFFGSPPRASHRYPPGSLLFIEEARLDDIAFSLRIQDISRQALTWGTKIPVVRESDAFTGPADLLNVPIDSRFRLLLRVYDFHPSSAHRVRISGFAIDPDLDGPPEEPEVPFKAFSIERDLVLHDLFDENTPGYAEVDLDQIMASFPAISPIRLRIEPIGEPFSWWAFVSVTNNATQHVTIVTPD